MKFKHIIISLLVVLLISTVTFAVNPPEFSGESSIKAADPVGFRVKAEIDISLAMDENTTEYGFLITRKVFLSGNGLSNEDLKLDCNAFYTKGISKGIVDGQEVDIFFEKDDTRIVFTGYMHGIKPYYYTDIIVARPYVITSGENYYGAPVELCLYDMAKQVKKNTALYDSLDASQKAVIDSIIIYVEGEPYILNPDDYRVVLSCTVIKNQNPTYSISYDLYNPYTGETQKRVVGRLRTKDVDLLKSMIEKSGVGAVVPVSDGLVQDTTEGYVISKLCADNALWIKSVDTESNGITLVPADISLTCKDCINEYVTSTEDTSCAKIPENLYITVVTSDTAYDLENGVITSTDIEKVSQKDTSLLCHALKGEEKVYSDYIKAYAYVDNDGECRFLIVTVNGGENSALDDKCLKHTYFDVKFMVDRKEYSSEKVLYNNFATLPEAPEKEGHNFLGWSESENGETVNPEEISITASKIFYAVFQKQSFEVKFMVDGEEYDVKTVFYCEKVTAPEAPEKEGYDFLGWSESENGEVVNPEEIEVTEAKTYYAVFKKQSFKVKFMVDGEEYDVKTVLYGDYATLPEAPEKQGHDFLGWSEVENGEVVNPEETEVTEAKTYYAVFQKQSFKVKFMVDGGEYEVKTVSYGDFATLPEAPEKEGYDFIGWFESENGEFVNPEEAAVAESKTYYAVFEKQSFEVKFIVDGKEYDVKTVFYGDNVTVPVSPSKENHNFLGWFESENGEFVNPEEVAVTESKTYYAVFKKYSFEVKFMVDGGEYEVKTVSHGDFATLPEAPEKEGYDFLGWSESESSEVVNPEEIEVTEAKTYYAVFQKQSFEVKFMVDGGEYEVKTVLYGEKVTSPELPEKEGHDFVGWSEVENGEVVNPEKTEVTEAKTYYAVFQKQSFKVKFMVDGGEYKVESVSYGDNVTSPEAPEKEGYDFIGWFESENGEIVNPEEIEVTEAKTFYAVFQKQSFEVKFIVDGEEYEVKTVLYGEKITAPVSPSKENHNFIGWFESENGEFVNPEEVAVTESKIFYAVFKKYSFEVKFMVDGGEYEVKTVSHGDFATLPEAPEKEGYDFLGWSESENGETVTIEEIEVTEAKTYYAVFKKQSYEVKFIVDGEEYDVKTVLYGEKITAPVSPSKENHNFIGWSESENGEIVNIEAVTIAEAKTYYAVFQKYSFEVKFMVDGGEYKVEIVSYGEKVTAPEAPEKQGHDFLGWSETSGGEVADVEALPITQDKVYYSVFKLNVHTVSFYAGGKLYTTQTIVFGKNVKEPKAPEIHGNIFHGWSGVEGGTIDDIINVTDIVVTQDIDFYAVLEALENDPNLIEILTRGKYQLEKKVRTSNPKYRSAIALITECMGCVINDATNGIYIDKKYIYNTYNDLAKQIKVAIKDDMTKEERSSFVNLLTNTRYVDKDVQEYLMEYFDIDMSKI